MRPNRVVSLLVIAVAAASCAKGDPNADQARGHALSIVAPDPAEYSAIYKAALGASFQPGTSLLLDPQYLPRSQGWSGGDPVPDDIRRELRNRSIVLGVCKPDRSQKSVPVCDAEDQGYVVRISPVFRVAGDTVEVYVGVVKYRTNPNQPSEALRYEKAYRAVGSGENWAVIREARLPAPD